MEQVKFKILCKVHKFTLAYIERENDDDSTELDSEEYAVIVHWFINAKRTQMFTY